MQLCLRTQQETLQLVRELSWTPLRKFQLHRLWTSLKATQATDKGQPQVKQWSVRREVSVSLSTTIPALSCVLTGPGMGTALGLLWSLLQMTLGTQCLTTPPLCHISNRALPCWISVTYFSTAMKSKCLWPCWQDPIESGSYTLLIFFSYYHSNTPCTAHSHNLPGSILAPLGAWQIPTSPANPVSLIPQQTE